MEETKQCQNCKNDFKIEPEDFAFYDKIHVPAPTFCPECRMIQILLWRNQRSLYKRECSLTGDSIISIYDKDTVFPVYKTSVWKSDDWDPYSYSQEYNFDIPFFEQFKNLLNKVPRIAITHIGSVINSDYSNIVFDSKNIYLSSSILNSEDIMYSSNIDYSKFIVDSDNALKSEDCFEILNSEQCFNCTYVFDSRSCIDSDYLYDCVNCQNCLLCTNQRNKNYMINNVQYSKEDYFNIRNQINFSSFSERNDLFSQFKNLKEKSIHKYNRNRACNNVIGETTENSTNCNNVFLTYDSENIENAIRVVKSKDCKDVYGIGPDGSLLYQDLTCSLGTVNTQFSINISGSYNILYSVYCSNSHDLFGCIGLKNAQYCIFNKQYEKAEYEELLNKIKDHMLKVPYIDSLCRIYKFGDFFPFEMSPFKYNETVAIDYRLITKEDALLKGYGWKDREKNLYSSTILSNDLPDFEYPDQIESSIILCGGNTLLCSSSYRITQDELSFYKKHNLPIPRFCPMCRVYNRFMLQYPYKLYTRSCMNNCGRTFETTYAPDRLEIVYCESCYQQEVI